MVERGESKGDEMPKLAVFGGLHKDLNAPKAWKGQEALPIKLPKFDFSSFKVAPKAEKLKLETLESRELIELHSEED